MQSKGFGWLWNKANYSNWCQFNCYFTIHYIQKILDTHEVGLVTSVYVNILVVRDAVNKMHSCHMSNFQNE